MCGLVQEVQPHQAEAVGLQGQSVSPTCLSSDISLDDLIASLRLEQGELAAALLTAQDSLQEQARLQQQMEAKQAAAAAAHLAAEKAKPKARPASVLHTLSFSPYVGVPRSSVSCCPIGNAMNIAFLTHLEKHLDVCVEAPVAAIKWWGAANSAESTAT